MMTNLDKFKQMVAEMSAEELTEYFGGDSCENALCQFVGSRGRCCRSHANKDRYINGEYSCRECIESYLEMGD